MGGGCADERDTESLIVERGDNTLPRLCRRVLDQAREIGDALGGGKSADGAHGLLAVRGVDPRANRMGHNQAREQDEQRLSEEAPGKKTGHSVLTAGVNV